jgi:hypothetical protein
VGALVARAEAAGVALDALDGETIAGVLAGSEDPRARQLASEPSTAERLRAAATVEAAVARPDVVGGTAPTRVHAELAAAAERLGLR